MDPVPNDPPTTDRVVKFPEHIGFTVAFILAGATERVFTLIITLVIHAVVLQVPSALT